jgi:uncharacterized cupredoxin-like copper-binding protein
LSRVSVLIGLLFGTALVLGCGGDDGDETSPSEPSADADLTVNLTNWAIEPSVDTVPAGEVMVVAVHVEGHGGHGDDEGGEIHQLIVAPLADGEEAGKGQFESPVLNLSDIEIGETATGAVTLEPGTYELACLVVEEVDGETVNHYEKGMYTTITVS